MAIITKSLQAMVESVAAADIDFVAPDIINSTILNLSVFAIGDIINIVGSTSNDGQYIVDTSSANVVTIIEQTLLTENGLSTTDIIESIVNPPNAITGLAAGVVAVPTLISGQASIAASIPNVIPNLAAGSVAAPNTLTTLPQPPIPVVT